MTDFRMVPRRTRQWLATLILGVGVLLAGCSEDPTADILSAEMPPQFYFRGAASHESSPLFNTESSSSASYYSALTKEEACELLDQWLIDSEATIHRRFGTSSICGFEVTLNNFTGGISISPYRSDPIQDEDRGIVPGNDINSRIILRGG